MIATGYNAKLDNPQNNAVTKFDDYDDLTINNCLSKSLANQNSQEMNHKWYFYSSEEKLTSAIDKSISNTKNFRFFFYEVYDKLMLNGQWMNINSAPFTDVKRPINYLMKGYDIITDGIGELPVSSILADNNYQPYYCLNEYGLVNTFAEALDLITLLNIKKPYAKEPYMIMTVFEKIYQTKIPQITVALAETKYCN